MSQPTRKKRTTRRKSTIQNRLKKYFVWLLVVCVIIVMARWVLNNYRQSQQAGQFSGESQNQIDRLQAERDRLQVRNDLLQTDIGRLDVLVQSENARLPGEEVIVLVKDRTYTETNSDVKKDQQSWWSWLPFVE